MHKLFLFLATNAFHMKATRTKYFTKFVLNY